MPHRLHGQVQRFDQCGSLLAAQCVAGRTVVARRDPLGSGGGRGRKGGCCHDQQGRQEEAESVRETSGHMHQLLWCPAAQASSSLGEPLGVLCLHELVCFVYAQDVPEGWRV
ncbi:protein of unknown function [Trichlorobacter ammonificans]|uniref:Uncharacterized protein n=1 Tax=Trichlorobacter ammonificans TaxID=2916410 RepID=A0ABN8HC25_9BACT|nr:protein of unknown function [Trichlorobacter ammonificans]